jgi:hypothetical protein
VFSFRIGHVFSSRSVLLAAPHDLGHAIPQYEIQKQTLPKGLKLRIDLSEPIDSRSAEIGDSITAKLENTVALGNGTTIPAGALVSGYLRQFARTDFDEPSYIAGLEFDEISWADQAAEFFGKEISTNHVDGTNEIVSHSEIRLGKISYWGNTETFTPPEIPGVAIFF